MSSKRVYQLQEFPAHSTVNCLRLGRKSGRVLVTGGEDKLVNMWAIGKPAMIMSLAGHNTPVECVCFDAAEEIVVAGSSGGSLKLWDLDEQKVVRTLTGHKSNCISVDFHPFGEFFASGSFDTHLKIWDIRRKGCIQTYAGHSKAINTIRFSPDGRWVVSGDEDGVVKLWDLTAGKLLNDFRGHSGPITSLEFHPNEFLLATGSSDRTVKFWDLETFENVSSTDPDTSKIKALTFTPDGSCLLSSQTDSLKVLGWEPTRCLDQVHINWNMVEDVNITSDQVVACSILKSVVTVWVVQLQKLRPFAKDQVIFDPVDVKSSLNMNRTSEALSLLHGTSNWSLRLWGDPHTGPRADDTKPIEAKSSQPERTSNLKTSGEIIAQIMKPHIEMCGMMNSRCTSMQIVRTLWAKNEIREAIDSMTRLNDPAVVVDILNVIGEKGSVFTLDMCVILLPVLNDLLSSQHEDYVFTALTTAKLLINNFGGYIRSTLEAPPSSGVDLSREERLEKCNYCRNALETMKSRLEKVDKYSGKVGQLIRELDSLIDNTISINAKNL